MKELRYKIKPYILPAVTVGLALFLVLSYLFPNRVPDTYPMNVSTQDNQETKITLPEGSVISYTMNTGKRPLRGIQPGISVEGGIFTQGVLRYRVYRQGSEALLSDNVYRLSELSAAVLSSLPLQPESAQTAQYIFLPFDGYEKCKGDIRITFSYESEGDTPQPMQQDAGMQEQIVPALVVNEVRREGTGTWYDGEAVEGGLTGYYVYTHNTYPLVYDLRILVFVFLAASAAGCSSVAGRSSAAGCSSAAGRFSAACRPSATASGQAKKQNADKGDKHET